MEWAVNGGEVFREVERMRGILAGGRTLRE